MSNRSINEKFPVFGLTKKHSLCKICNSFSTEDLNDITLDLLLRRRTYIEIIEHYSKLLPAGTKKLNPVNLANHKRHCNPKLLAEQMLENQGKATTPDAAAVAAFNDVFKDTLDKQELMTELYKRRVGNLELIYRELTTVLHDLEPYLGREDLTPTERVHVKGYESRIRSLTKDKDAIENSMQQVLLKDSQIEKGLSENSISITQNYVVIIQQNIQNLLQDIIPYLLEDIFSNDLSLGQEVVKVIAEKIDSHLGKYLNMSPDASITDIKNLIGESTSDFVPYKHS